MRETAREFVKTVRPEDSLALITFADQPVVEHAMSTNRQLTFDAIDKATNRRAALHCMTRSGTRCSS